MSVHAKLVELEDRIKDLEAQEVRGGGGDVELIGVRTGTAIPKTWNVSNVYKDLMLRGSSRFGKVVFSQQIMIRLNGDSVSVITLEIPAADQKYWWFNTDIRRNFGPTEIRYQLDHTDTIDTWEEGQGLHGFHMGEGSPDNFFTTFEWFFPNPAGTGAAPSWSGSWVHWPREEAGGQGMIRESGWGWRHVNTDPLTSLLIQEVDAPGASNFPEPYFGGTIYSLYGLK
jgi:hypothetical protein